MSLLMRRWAPDVHRGLSALLEEPGDGRIAAFDDPEQARKDFIARQPLGRLGTAEEIAAMAVYLAGDESRYTTGTAMVLDGGLTL